MERSDLLTPLPHASSLRGLHHSPSGSRLRRNSYGIDEMVDAPAFIMPTTAQAAMAAALAEKLTSDDDDELEEDACEWLEAVRDLLD